MQFRISPSTVVSIDKNRDVQGFNPGRTRCDNGFLCIHKHVV
jgi:hypothetical protein